MKGSFVFYRSFYEAIEELEEDTQLEVLKAILEFEFTKKDPILSGISKSIFILIKPQLIANDTRYENGCKGGRPKTKNKPKQNQKITKTKPNENENDNVNENEINNNIINYYSENIHTITTIEYEKLILWEKEFDPDLIKYAIELAVSANARSFNYIEAIFKSWKNKGYKSKIDIIDFKKKEDVPNWYNKKIKKEEVSDEERKELEKMMKGIK